jgi:hypothetical protein
MSSYERTYRCGRLAAIRLLGLVVLAIAGFPSGGADAQSIARTPGRELVDAIGIENIMRSPIHQQLLVFMRPLQEANKDRQREVFEIFDQTVVPQALAVFTANPVKDEIGKYYDQNFSAAELQDLIKFFSTPLGKKFADRSSFLSDGLPRVAVRLMATVTVQGALRLGMEEIQRRGMVIPKSPAQ